MSTIGDGPRPTWPDRKCDLGVHYQVGAMGRPRQIEKALQVDSEVKHQLTGYHEKNVHTSPSFVYMNLSSYYVRRSRDHGVSLCKSKHPGSSGILCDHNERLLITISFRWTFVILCIYCNKPGSALKATEQPLEPAGNRVRLSRSGNEDFGTLGRIRSIERLSQRSAGVLFSYDTAELPASQRSFNE
jgi:hypothetical protein